MFGKQMRQLRKLRKISRTKLAKALCTDRQTIASWEEERALPYADQLYALCIKLCASSDYLLGLTDINRIPTRKKP